MSLLLSRCQAGGGLRRCTPVPQSWGSGHLHMLGLQGGTLMAGSRPEGAGPKAGPVSAGPRCSARWWRPAAEGEPTHLPAGNRSPHGTPLSWTLPADSTPRDTHPLPLGVHAVASDVCSVGQPSGGQRRWLPGDLDNGCGGPRLDSDILWGGRRAWEGQKEQWPSGQGLQVAVTAPQPCLEDR